jgi:hypothetical protein
MWARPAPASVKVGSFPMKTAGKLLAGVSIVMFIAFIARADDKKVAGKEVTLKGTITCAKCDLKLQSKCNTVIKVKEDGKDIVYYFDKDSNKKYHGDTCMGAKEGSVTGTTSTKDDKHWVAVNKVKYAD